MKEDNEKILKYAMRYAEQKFLETDSTIDRHYLAVQYWCECLLKGLEAINEDKEPEPIKKKIRL